MAIRVPTVDKLHRGGIPVDRVVNEAIADGVRYRANAAAAATGDPIDTNSPACAKLDAEEWLGMAETSDRIVRAYLGADVDLADADDVETRIILAAIAG